MANNELQVRLRHASKTTVEWEQQNPIPLKGEVCYDSTTKRQKTGDGVKTWKQLDYDDEYIRSKVDPIDSKSYQGIYATANDQGNGNFYFLEIKPNTFYNNWFVEYSMEVDVPNQEEYKGSFKVKLFGSKNRVTGYVIDNSHTNDSYRTIWYHAFYGLKQAGFNNGFGHYAGIGLRSAPNNTNANYARNFEIVVENAEGCTVNLTDNMLLLKNINGSGSTNYTGISEYNATTNGTKHAADDNNYAVIRYNDALYVGVNGIYGSQLICEDKDGKYQSLTSVRSTATTKAKNAVGFRIDKILYNSSGSTYTNGNITASWCMHEMHPGIDYRYSFNCGTTLISRKPIYIVGTMNAQDGLFYLADNWLSQELPTSDDGKVYKYIGEAYNNYCGSFTNTGDLFWFKNNAVRKYPETGFVAYKNVPSDAVFTDTNTWRPVVNNLSSTAADQSLSAAQGKILNETKAVNIMLNSEDLNSITTPGFYNAGSGNNVTSKPSGVAHFGLEVIHGAAGAYYTQILHTDSTTYRRKCINGNWSAWTEDKYTDNDTHHTAKNIVGASNSAKADATATNGNVYLNLVENNTVRSHTKIVGSGGTTVTSDSNGDITISSPSADVTYNLTKTLTVTTTWTDVGITGSNLQSGSYVVQISGMSSNTTSMWNEIFTGFMSWWADATNSTDSDEILLHSAGHATNGRHLFLRTIRSTATGNLKLQIAANANMKSSAYTFKFRKLI